MKKKQKIQEVLNIREIVHDIHAKIGVASYCINLTVPTKNPKNYVLVHIADYIKLLLEHLYPLSEQMHLINNIDKNFSISDTTYYKFLKEHLFDAHSVHKKNMVFFAKKIEIAQLFERFPNQYKAQFEHLNLGINENVSYEDYIYFIKRYYSMEAEVFYSKRELKLHSTSIKGVVPNPEDDGETYLNVIFEEPADSLIDIIREILEKSKKSVDDISTDANKQELQKQELQRQELQKQELQRQELQKQELQRQELQKQELQRQELQEQERQRKELQEQERQRKELQEQERQRKELQEQEALKISSGNFSKVGKFIVYKNYDDRNILKNEAGYYKIGLMPNSTVECLPQLWEIIEKFEQFPKEIYNIEFIFGKYNYETQAFDEDYIFFPDTAYMHYADPDTYGLVDGLLFVCDTTYQKGIKKYMLYRYYNGKIYAINDLDLTEPSDVLSRTTHLWCKNNISGDLSRFCQTRLEWKQKNEL